MKKTWVCKGGNCPLKEECLRYAKKLTENQQYYTTVPYDENGGKCDFYLPMWMLDMIKNQKPTTKHAFTHNNIRDKKGRKIG